MAIELPKLPYDFSALEPYIDATTMEIHHGKHHAGYVTNLNTVLSGHEDLLSMPVEMLLKNLDKVPEDKKQAVINNAGGHANHSLFWQIMTPGGSVLPQGELSDAIQSTFGSLDTFQKQFTDKALSVFGSGWVFLCISNGKLEIKRHSFQNSPYLDGKTPLLGLDVWEHAYYLKYQNRRAEYVDAWWNVVNWKQVNINFINALDS